jgi:hypothetical protein
MHTGHLPFRVSRKYRKATSHNHLIVNPITICAVTMLACLHTDAGVCSQGGVIFFDGRCQWVCRPRIDPDLLSLILSVAHTVFAEITVLQRQI